MNSLKRRLALMLCVALASCGGGAGRDAPSSPASVDPVQVLAASNALLDAEGASFKLSAAQSQRAVPAAAVVPVSASSASQAQPAVSPAAAAAAPASSAAATVPAAPSTVAMAPVATAPVTPSAAAATPAAVAQVVALQKVSEVRVSRTVYDYTFKVTLASPDKDLARAQALLTETGVGTTLLNPVAYFGAVAKSASVTSENTVSLRHDRTLPFDLTALRWKVSTYVTPTQPAMAMNVTQAVLDPAVVLADGALSADPVNPLILIDPTGNWGASVGTVLRFDGTVRKVLRVETLGNSRRLFTEELPFVAAFKQLSYRASLSPLADASMQAANPAQAAPAGARPPGDVTGRRYKQAAGDPLLLSKLQAAMLVSCITPTPALEGETGELTVKFEFDCAISDLAAAFGKNMPNVGRIYGNVEHTSKDEHVFSLDAGNDYVESRVSVKSNLGIELSGAGAIPEWNTKGGSGCEKTTTGTECTFKVMPLKHFERVFVVGGVPVPVTADLDFNIVVQLAGSGGFKVYAEHSRNTTKGVRDREKVDLRGDVVATVRPTLQMQAGVVPSADFSAEAGAQIGANIDFGSLKFKALEGFNALKDAAFLNISLAAGGYARAQPHATANKTLCAGFDAGLKAKGEVTLLKSDFLASLGFTGFKLVEAEHYWPVMWKDSYPKNCTVGLDQKRVQLFATLDGVNNYTLNTADSSVNLDVLSVSGQWLNEKIAGNRPFTINFTRTLTDNPTFNNIIVEQIIEDVGFGIEWKWLRKDADSYGVGASLIFQFTPGRLQPGDKVRFRFTAHQPGKLSETSSNRGIRLEFEVPPAALPTYEFRRTAEGKTSYVVDLGFLGNSRSRVTSARIERALATATTGTDGVDGVEYVSWGYEQTGPTSTAWMLNANEEIPGYGRQDQPTLRPAFLLLETLATEGVSAVYRVPIQEKPAPRVDSISFDKPIHLVLQTVKVSIHGGNLPPDLKLVIPWCVQVEEVDYDREARRIGNEYSNVERFFTCTAAKIGDRLPVAVLDGLKTAHHAVENPLGFPTAYAASQLVQGEESTFGMRWGNGNDLFNNPHVQVMWEFGQGMVSALVSIADRVKTVFATAGEKVLQLVYSIFGETFASRPTQAFTVQPGSGVNVTNVTPLVAMAGVAQTFDVSGNNLPQGLFFNLKDCDNVTEVLVGTGPALRRFICTFASTAAAGEYEGHVASSNSIFGPAPYHSFKVLVSRASLGSISPDKAMRTLAASFQVTGQNLPTTGLTVVPVRGGDDNRSNCQAPNNPTVNGFGVACELYTLGAQVLEVKAGGAVLGTVTVNVTTNVSGVTWTSPSSNNSGTVKFGELVTYSVRGSNLLADPVMGFAVEQCGVANTEIGQRTETLRTFSCWFNNEAGAVAGVRTLVVKDSIGGQLLYSGTVPLETAPIDVNDSIVVSWDLGSIGTALQGRGTNPRTVAINGGIEIEGFLDNAKMDVDISPDKIRLFNFRSYPGAPAGAAFDAAAFNGVVLSVPSGANWTFSGAGVGGGNTLGGLVASRLDPQAQRLAINLAGLSYSGSTVVEVSYTRGNANSVGAVIASSLNDEFNGIDLDLTKWTSRPYRPGFGDPKVANGLVHLANCQSADTAGKVVISGSRIVIESRFAGQKPSGRDSRIMLTDPISKSLFNVGDSNYWGGIYLQLSRNGVHEVVKYYSGTTTTQFKEYRITLEGKTVTIERGDNLSALTTKIVEVMPRSVTDGSYYVTIGTGGCDGVYSPADFDWIRISAGSGQPTSGTFTVLSASATGTIFTVPAAVTTCSFTAPGTWLPGYGYTVTADGNSLADHSPWVRLLPTANWFSLIAKAAVGYRAIGSNGSLTVASGEQYAFMMNEGTGVPGQDPYFDNSGALTVAYTCR